MAVILGIDIGTSSVKAMLLDTNDGVSGCQSKKYEVQIPKANYAEQNPEVWWESLVQVLHRLNVQFSEKYRQIEAIGFSGQMHGLVAVDESGNAIRPAIIWLDQRSEKQVEYLNQFLDEKEKRQVLRNHIFTGFALPSLLWIKENEQENYKKIYKIFQPKDYIRMKMTGKFGTEVTDASATAMFDVQNRTWAWEILKKLEVNLAIFPKCSESTKIAGYITNACSLLTGLKQGIPVVYGAGDQQAQSIGNGVVEEGLITSNIGTGGQISTFIKTAQYDQKLRTHTFCHAIDKGYTIFGATLCSGMSMKWMKDRILKVKEFDEMSRMAEDIVPGSEGVIYLPYLSGERTPYMNPKASGAFWGLKLLHDRRHMIRAVMEGVTFSLKDSLNIFEELGIKGNKIIASGGGAGSDVWLQMQADIFEKEVVVSEVKEQACLGACIVAGVGSGMFKETAEACGKFAKLNKKVYVPNTNTFHIYRKNYEMFKELYDRNSDLMA